MIKNYDVVVIGGGAGGMAAAIEASKLNVKTLLIERDYRLGGILNQCIHNGFGLHYFKEELTGPEYALRFKKLVEKSKIEVMLNTFVVSVNNKKILIQNESGLIEIHAKAVVLAMGCREKTAGNINLTGTRPAGIYTAGQVQKMVNCYGLMPGKNAVILGSGDIGLIMARRLIYEGAKVNAVLEIMKNTSGLARNVQQCIKDFNIPLLFSTTITRVVGKDRVEGIYYAQVDDKFNVILGTEKFMKCDLILLSVGLVPENNIVNNLSINKVTNGAFVNEYREILGSDGVFACGNVLHVHDLVDNVTNEAIIAGKSAGLFAKGILEKGKEFDCVAGDEIRYVMPNKVFNGSGKVVVNFRVGNKQIKKYIVAQCNNQIISKKFAVSINAGEMQEIEVDKSKINGTLVIKLMDKVGN